MYCPRLPLLCGCIPPPPALCIPPTPAPGCEWSQMGRASLPQFYCVVSGCVCLHLCPGVFCLPVLRGNVVEHEVVSLVRPRDLFHGCRSPALRPIVGSTFSTTVFVTFNGLEGEVPVPEGKEPCKKGKHPSQKGTCPLRISGHNRLFSAFIEWAWYAVKLLICLLVSCTLQGQVCCLCSQLLTTENFCE